MTIFKRLIFLLLIWLPFFNIAFSTIFLLIPYWVKTGKVIYDSKFFKKVNDFHQQLLK